MREWKDRARELANELDQIGVMTAHQKLLPIVQNAIDFLEALAAAPEPAQEPVLHESPNDGDTITHASWLDGDDTRREWFSRPLYAAPAPETAPYSPPFTADVPQCCGDPSSCDTPCAPEPAHEPVLNLIVHQDGDWNVGVDRENLPAPGIHPLYAAPAPSDAQDAARYRWLRDLPEGSPHEQIGNMPGEWWDDAIDAAIAAEGKRE